MCGIFGWLSRDERIDTGVVWRATSSIRHRGPDDEGYLFVNSRTGVRLHCGGDDTEPSLKLPLLSQAAGQRFDVALGFRRLSILDLSPAGHQPMASADGSLWLIFNGEIYNFVELKRELEAKGHTFASRSDSEVILAAYREWGPACLRRFVGMWALVIWNSKDRSLFLARDPFGIKPLYIAKLDDGIAFASEIKAVLELPQVLRRANPQTVFDYLRLGITDHATSTLFAGVEHLPPAHYLTVRASALSPAEPVRYWTPSSDEQRISMAQAASRLREMFVDSVRLHLRSDVPVGTALSGGIDSSAIVSTIRCVDNSARLSTFSFVPDDAQLTEEKWVDIVVEATRAASFKVHGRAEDIIEDIDDLIRAQDEPFASTSIYAQYRVFRLVQEHGVRVMLDGQGADETLGGYRTYFPARLASLLRRAALGRSMSFLRAAASMPGCAMSSIALEAAGRFVPRGIEGPLRRLVGRDIVPDWLNSDYFSRAQIHPSTRHLGNGTPNVLRATLRDAVLYSSLPRLLRYEDRNSMRHSVESRVPFLTTPIVDFVLTLPEDLIISDDAITKAVFRQAMQGIVPDVILSRRDKIGFATPENKWALVLERWIESVFESPAAGAIPAINLEVARAKWRRTVANGTPWQPWMWRWLNLIRWADVFRVSFA